MAAAAQRKPLGLQIFLSGFVIIWLIMAAFPFIWTLWECLRACAEAEVAILVLDRPNPVGGVVVQAG